MCLHDLQATQRSCPCGCGHSYAVFEGRLQYAPDKTTAFRVAHMSHNGSGPHVWMAFQFPPRVGDSTCDYWIAAHLWVDDGQIITRIEDAADAPFWSAGTDGVRLLTREEVAAHPDGMNWAISRRLQFEEHHRDTAAFINEFDA